MNAHDLLGRIRDERLARGLEAELVRDGWRVDLGRVDEARWRARVAGPRLAGAVEGSGLTRVSAIAAAHLEAVRRLRLVDEAGAPPTGSRPSSPRGDEGPLSEANLFHLLNLHLLLGEI